MSSAEPEIPEQDYRAVSTHLFREAQLLDRGHFTQWLHLLADEVRYRLVAPTFVMSRSGGADTEKQVTLMDETLESLKVRVQQLVTPSYTIAENPKSFTRRFVANILIESVGDDGVIEVQSNVLAYRSRADQMEPHVFSMTRSDTFRKTDGRLFLVRREAILDESVVSARSISALF